MEYALVNLITEEVVPQLGQTQLTFKSLERVNYPDVNTSVVFSDEVGHFIPPFKLYELSFITVGSGPITSNLSDPVFDPVPDTVTVTITLEDAPAPPTKSEMYDDEMKLYKVLKAFALCINDGSIVPGANVSKAALKVAIKAKM